MYEILMRQVSAYKMTMLVYASRSYNIYPDQSRFPRACFLLPSLGVGICPRLLLLDLPDIREIYKHSPRVREGAREEGD